MEQERILKLYGTDKKGIELDGKYYTLELNNDNIIFVNHYIENGSHKESCSNSIKKDDLLDLIHLSIFQ